MRGGYAYEGSGGTPYGASRPGNGDVQNASANLVESQRALGQVIGENQGLKTRLGELEAILGDLSREASKVNGLEEECRTSREALQRYQKENQNLKDSVRFAEDELRSQSKKREAAEIATAQAEAEKRRFQSARDDLAAQLRLANERLREAEEEQCRAEGEAAAAKRELQFRQRTDNETGGSADITALQQELEVERSRTDGLASALAKARSEAQFKNTELKNASLRIRELEAGMTLSAEKISQPSSPRTEPRSPSAGTNNGTSSVASPRSQQDSQEELRNEAAKLRRKIGVLKNSRDKLLFEVDRQSVEVEALHAEMFVVKQELEDARKLSSYWKAHTSNSVNRIEKLRDMLEESAKWSLNPQSGDPSGRTQGDLEGELMQERALAAGLDKEVRKLTLDLVDSTQQNQQLKRSWLPVLHGIESNLMHLASSAADAVD